MILKVCKDKVSNVRMNTAIVIQKMTKVLKYKEILKEIKITLEELKKDKDVDVVNIISDGQIS